MGRQLRVKYPGAVYHITSRGNEKRAIFIEDEDRVKLLEKLKERNVAF
jgi:REP element-mobilizing transposase RayT